MKLSTRARYGLRITFLIGVANDTIPLSALVKQTDLSEKYLEQLLGMLRKGGVIESVRGAGGGYYLKRATSEITIKEILLALDDDFAIDECINGKCTDEYCPNKIIFKRLYDGISGLLSSTTLEDMINDYRCVR